MASFNFDLNSFVTKDKQLACNPLQYSCCGLREQQIIEASLVTGKQQLQIQQRLEFYKNVFQKLIDFFGESQTLVKGFMETFQGNKINNCYVMAKQMSLFDIKDIKDDFFKQLDEMFTFVEKAQVGSLCSVCDFQNHNKVQFQDNQIIYSERFCREMVVSSSKPLLYLHELLIRLLNLSTQFYFECHPQGSYIPNPDIKKWTLLIDEDFTKQVQKCLKNSDTLDWQRDCQSLCGEFNFGSINEQLFAPNYYKIFFITKLLTLRMEKFQDKIDLSQDRLEEIQAILQHFIQQTVGSAFDDGI